MTSKKPPKKVEHHHTWNTEQNQRYENNSDCDNIEAIVMDFLGNLKNGRIKVFFLSTNNCHEKSLISGVFFPFVIGTVC